MFRFSFEDGLIKQICPNDDEPIWALNMKRGILSALQNTMDRFDVDQTTHEVSDEIFGSLLIGFLLERESFPGRMFVFLSSYTRFVDGISFENNQSFHSLE